MRRDVETTIAVLLGASGLALMLGCFGAALTAVPLGSTLGAGLLVGCAVWVLLALAFLRWVDSV